MDDLGFSTGKLVEEIKGAMPKGKKLIAYGYIFGYFLHFHFLKFK